MLKHSESFLYSFKATTFKEKSNLVDFDYTKVQLGQCFQLIECFVETN